MRSSAHLTRFEITGSRFDNGELLISGKGLAGEEFKDQLFIQPHGAASRPPTGAIGVAMIMTGRRTQALLMGIEHAGKRPDLPQGAAALYDADGNIIKLFAGGVTMDFGSRTITMTGGTWNLKGNLNVDGNIFATGSIIDTTGNTNHHSH
ncbi:phage baseplate assembly protein [Mesorhizobium sp. WSM3859]|uniref:phage baseplate assembly protein domain-containing protein n=1 Tax=Mesorhizobium sp. WSM3859 TaxID=2029402 RepID=UPI0015968F43|nr:phage baseplate assembly protein [Mesorhizobium sp. WSM3859]